MASLLYLGYSHHEVAAAIGWDPRDVWKFIVRYDLPKNNIPFHLIARLRYNLLAGGDLDEICAVHSITPAYLSRRIISCPPYFVDPRCPHTPSVCWPITISPPRTELYLNHPRRRKQNPWRSIRPPSHGTDAPHQPP